MGVVQVLPYPSAVAVGPVGNLVTAISGFVTPGTNSTISVTHPDLSGITPKVALVLGSRHNALADPVQSGQSGFTIGAEHVAGRFSGFDGLGFCSGSRTAQASTTVQKYQALGPAYFTTDYGITIFNNGNLALKSGGTDIAFTVSSGAYHGSVLFFGGSDIDAVASYRDLGTAASLQNIEIGCDTDAIITFANGSRISNGRASSHALSFGFATKDGQQRCLLHTEANAQAAGAPFAAILTDACAGEINPSTGALSYKVTASDFDDLGFSLQSNVNAGDDTVGFIALDLGGRRCKIVEFTSPTSTGTLSVTGAGFTPQTAIIVGSNLESVNPTFPLSTSALMSNFMVSTVTADDERCHVMKIASSADPTSTHCWSTEKAVAILGPTGTPTITANLGAFTTDGMELAFDTVTAIGKRFFALLIE